MRLRSVRLGVSAVASVLFSAVLTACGGPAPAGNVVGVDYPRSDTDFWNSYIKYVPRYADQLHMAIKTTNSQNDVANLTANVQTLVSQGVKGVVMAPQDTAAVVPTLNTLASKKIPVVSVDTRPDGGTVYMVVRADNRAYGEKACRFLGAKLHGAGKVVMLEGDLSSINGRDRTDAFNQCMAANFPNIAVFGDPANWDSNTASQKLQTELTAHPDIKGVYMQASFGLAPTVQILKQRNLLVPPTDPRHVFVVSNDGIAEELKDIAAGEIDATVSQPADQYAQYALRYIQDAIAGKPIRPGPTDHNSTIVAVRPGVMEDQLSAPLVTADGASFGPVSSIRYDDKSLWANNSGS
jgi:ABC-type sugar transport system substrate-binding protein